MSPNEDCVGPRVEGSIPAYNMSIGSIGTSPSIGKIAGAIAKAQAILRHPGKDAEVDTGRFKYSYATLADSITAIRDAFASNGIAVIQSPANSRGTVRVTTLLAHESGEWMASEIEMSAGKGAPQDVGSAITYARRYALQAMAGIAPDDDDGAAAHKASVAQIEIDRSAPRHKPGGDSTPKQDLRWRLGEIARLRSKAGMQSRSARLELRDLRNDVAWPSKSADETEDDYSNAIMAADATICELRDIMDADELMPGHGEDQVER